MNKVLPLLYIFFYCTVCNAQTTEVKYYNKNYKEVPENKARYMKIFVKNDDSTRTIEETDLRTGNKTSETYKGYEPYGIWKEWKREIDYRFNLVYTTEECTNGDLIPKLNNYFEDKDSVGYKAPKISVNEEFYHFLIKEMQYPEYAREHGIQGRIRLRFMISRDGEVSDIRVLNGIHPLLDKNCVALIRKAKFTIPPKINGQPVSICVTMPFTYRLE